MNGRFAPEAAIPARWNTSHGHELWCTGWQHLSSRCRQRGWCNRLRSTTSVIAHRSEPPRDRHAGMSRSPHQPNLRCLNHSFAWGSLWGPEIGDPLLPSMHRWLRHLHRQRI